jgi:hypothetical protein
MSRNGYGILRKLRALWCRLNGGHYRLLHAAPGRLTLRCYVCGTESPGWNIHAAPGRLVAERRFRIEL